MKKILLSMAIAIMALSVVFVSCNKDPENNGNVTSVSIVSPTSTTINVGATLQLTASVLPETATDKSLLWESSDRIVAEVNPTTGLVTARSAGTATIKASSNQDPTKFDEINLTTERVPDAVWGDIDFKSTETWEITSADQTIKQVWSDVVVVENATSDYDGGSKEAGFKVAILKNTGYGDLLSWEAVNTLKNKLCPYPWRMPDTTDFIRLDIALGGTGLGVNPSTLVDAYVDRWGATLGGYAGTDGLAGQGTNGLYWSASENKQATETEPYGMAWALSITNGVTQGVIWVVPEGWVFNPEDFAGSLAGCPVGTLTASPDGCMTMGDIEQLITIPKSNLGKAAGYQVRCIRDIAE